MRSTRSPVPRSAPIAAANALTLSPVPADPIGSDRGWDVVLVGDAFYESRSPTAYAVAGGSSPPAARRSFSAIPGRSYFPEEPLRASASVPGAGHRALEDSEIKATNVWRFS